MDYINVAQCFGIVRRRTQALVVEACSDLNMTYSEIALILKLYDSEGCSQDEMANNLYLDKAVVTRVIKTLEEKELIYRNQDAIDRRLKRLYLTDKGRSLEPFIKGVVNKLLAFLAKDMDPKQVELLMEGFTNLSKKLSVVSYEQIYGAKGGMVLDEK